MSQASASAISAATSSEMVADREFKFTEEDFRGIAKSIYDDAGIFLPESKAPLVYSRLVKRLRALKLESFRDYCNLITSADGAAERGQMLTALTTNVTRFFREPHHFEYLKETVLPPLVAKAKAGGRVRLWSAACSTGEEPYSIALTILEQFPDAARYDIKILATDIDTEALAKAYSGIYPDDAVAPIAPSLLKKYLSRTAEHERFQLSAEPRELITFKKLNLNGEWPVKNAFDAIFCRNVVIYFDAPTQARVWSRLVNQLHEGGFLFIGHSERVHGDAATRVRNVGTTAYQVM